VVQTIIEPPLRHHCRVANLRDGNLILITDSPVWATRLRYLLPGLLDNLRQTATWVRIHCIDIKVRLAPDRHEETPRRRPVLSVQAVALLRDVAGKCEDESLTAAFLRIAGRG
jgi:hypothetical protein